MKEDLTLSDNLLLKTITRVVGWRRWSWQTWSSRPNPPHPHGWWPSDSIGTRALWLVLGLHQRAPEPRPFRIFGSRVRSRSVPALACSLDWVTVWTVPMANTINTATCYDIPIFSCFLTFILCGMVFIGFLVSAVSSLGCLRWLILLAETKHVFLAI